MALYAAGGPMTEERDESGTGNGQPGSITIPAGWAIGRMKGEEAGMVELNCMAEIY
jgi:hypothetical protein